MNNESQNQQIYLSDIFDVVLKKYKVVLLYTIIAILLSLVFAITRPNIYQSITLLKPSHASESSSIDSSLSGAASLVGIQIPSGGNTNKANEGIEVIKSLDFFKILVEKNESIFFNIAAAKKWNGREIIVDSNIYDVVDKKWVDKGKFSVNGKPSLQKVHKLYKKNLSVYKNLETGFVQISYKHYSPHFAKEILDEIIVQVNEKFRLEDMDYYDKSIKYLKAELSKTQLYEVKMSFNNLIQDQIAKLVLANSTEQYLFKILSYPYAPEVKFSPSRILILIIGSIVGFLFGCTYVIIRHLVLRT